MVRSPLAVAMDLFAGEKELCMTPLLWPFKVPTNDKSFVDHNFAVLSLLIVWLVFDVVAMGCQNGKKKGEKKNGFKKN